MRQLRLAAVAARRSCQPVAGYLAAPATRGRARRPCRALAALAQQARGRGRAVARPARPALGGA